MPFKLQRRNPRGPSEPPGTLDRTRSTGSGERDPRLMQWPSLTAGPGLAEVLLNRYVEAANANISDPARIYPNLDLESDRDIEELVADLTYLSMVRSASRSAFDESDRPDFGSAAEELDDTWGARVLRSQRPDRDAQHVRRGIVQEAVPGAQDPESGAHDPSGPSGPQPRPRARSSIFDRFLGNGKPVDPRVARLARDPAFRSIKSGNRSRLIGRLLAGDAKGVLCWAREYHARHMSREAYLAGLDAIGVAEEHAEEMQRLRFLAARDPSLPEEELDDFVAESLARTSPPSGREPQDRQGSSGADGSSGPGAVTPQP